MPYCKKKVIKSGASRLKHHLHACINEQEFMVENMQTDSHIQKNSPGT